MSLRDEDMARDMTPGQDVGKTGAKWGQAGHGKGKKQQKNWPEPTKAPPAGSPARYLDTRNEGGQEVRADDEPQKQRASTCCSTQVSQRSQALRSTSSTEGNGDTVSIEDWFQDPGQHQNRRPLKSLVLNGLAQSALLPGRRNRGGAEPRQAEVWLYKGLLGQTQAGSSPWL